MSRKSLAFASLIAFVFASAYPAALWAHGVVPSNTLKMGDGSASNKTIIFHKGAGTANPKIRWNNSTSKLQFSNDGTTFNDISSPTVTYSTTSKTGNYTVTASDFAVLCDASGGAFTITLPAASTVPNQKFLIKKTDSSLNGVTVSSASNIDTTTSYVIKYQSDTLEVVSDGTQYLITQQHKVTTPALGQTVVVGVTVDTTGPTLSENDGSVFSVNTKTATGDVTLNIATGVFGSRPKCNCNMANGSNPICQTISVSSTSVRFGIRGLDSPFAGVDGTVDLICVGRK